MLFTLEDFQRTTGKMKQFRHCDIERAVTRHFCENCGTGAASETAGWPGSIVINAGTSDHPTT